tara:strand:- start:432 stop:1040 length:609 start_codon:yes stop_codon:yes gene_type:complete
MKIIYKEMVERMGNRRSVKAKELQEPAPSPEELTQILTLASRVPDHKKLVPFRFILCDKAGQAAFGELLAEQFARNHPQEAKEKHKEAERQRALQAPLLIILVYQPVLGKVPEWEQQLTCGAAGMNLLNAVHAFGYAGQWLTEWPAFDAGIHQSLGLRPEDKIAGLFYIGSSDTLAEFREDRPRPEPDSVAIAWEAWQAGKR